MIYRISKRREVCQDLADGILKYDSDKIWEWERTSKEPDRLFLSKKYHSIRDERGRVDFYNLTTHLASFVITLGAIPFIDGVVYATRRVKRLINDKKDIKNDIIAVSAKEVLENKDFIKAKVEKLIKRGHKVSVVVDGCAQIKDVYGFGRIEYTFDHDSLLELWQFNEDLKQLGVEEPIKFNEFFETTKYTDLKTCWDLEQVAKANKEIELVAQKIKKLNLSPYEAMVYIHKYITKNYGYGLNAGGNMVEGALAEFLQTRNVENNRSIVSAVQNKKTICSGYAALTKAIIDELDLPGLACKYESVSAWKTNGKRSARPCLAGHALNLVYIEDPKYGIDGAYLNDATWDSKTEKCPHGRGYTYFMYPVTDMSKLKGIALNETFEGSRARCHPEGPFELDNIPIDGRDCEPIPYDTFVEAVKKVYSLESDFCQDKDPEKAAEKDILRSLRRAYGSRRDDVNPLVKQVDAVYTVTSKRGFLGKKKNNFELKNKENPLAEKIK